MDSETWPVKEMACHVRRPDRLIDIDRHCRTAWPEEKPAGTVRLSGCKLPGRNVQGAKGSVDSQVSGTSLTYLNCTYRTWHRHYLGFTEPETWASLQKSLSNPFKTFLLHVHSLLEWMAGLRAGEMTCRLAIEK